MRNNTEVVVARRGVNIGGRFIDSGKADLAAGK